MEGGEEATMSATPFHDLPTREVIIHDGIKTTIPSGATISVWKVKDSDSLHVSVRNPLPDGNKSLLKFGLSRPAAIALAGLLQLQLEPITEKDDQP